MSHARSVALAAALLTGACSPGISGEVRDATSGAPVAGATVSLGSVGWGTRDGQVVWDSAKSAQTTTDQSGAFAFASGGGSGLKVSAPGQPTVETSLCPRSPTLVRVGGPFPRLRASERLVFGAGGSGTPAAPLGLAISGDALNGGRALRLAADGGVSFVPGKGAVPVPPPLPYPRAVELDVAADCGWVFVSDGHARVAVVELGAPALEQEPDGTRRHVMLFARLPEPNR